MTCTEVSVSSSARQPPAAIVRFVVHSALAWLYVHTMWMSTFVDWDSIAFPTISEVGKFMSYMLTLWTLEMHVGFFSLATILDFFELMPVSVRVNKFLNKIRELNDFFFMTVMLPISMWICETEWPSGTRHHCRRTLPPVQTSVTGGSLSLGKRLSRESGRHLPCAEGNGKPLHSKPFPSNTFF